MKKTFTQYVRILLFLLVMSTPFLLEATSHTGAQLQNPVKGFDTVAKFIEGVLRAIAIIAMPVIGFFIVYAGFLYVKAQGNPGKLESAHTNLLYVVIGATLILGAWVFATLIGGTVSELTR